MTDKPTRILQNIRFENGLKLLEVPSGTLTIIRDCRFDDHLQIPTAQWGDSDTPFRIEDCAFKGDSQIVTYEPKYDHSGREPDDTEEAERILRDALGDDYEEL